eukprot:g2469.t1
MGGRDAPTENAKGSNFVMRMVHMYRDNFGFGGRFYKLALVGYELMEVPAQLYGLNENSKTQDIPNVFIITMVSLTSTNLIVTPILLICEASTFTLLIVDMALDSTFFILNLALIRVSPEGLLTDISLWFPAVMIASTVLDAWHSKEHESLQWESNPSFDPAPQMPFYDNTAHRRASLGSVLEKTVRAAVGSQKRQMFFVVLLASSGLVLFLSTLIRGTLQYNVCIEEHGEAWSCAEPQVYFGNGLFGEMSCATEKVRKFACGGAQFETLPNLTHFKNVKEIDITGNKELASLPYEILEMFRKMPNLIVKGRGSNANTRINWSGIPDLVLHDPVPLSNLCKQIDYQWHHSSRDIDATRFAGIGFKEDTDQGDDSSRNIDVEQFADTKFNDDTDQRHDSSGNIDASQFATFDVGSYGDQWRNSSGDIDA